MVGQINDYEEHRLSNGLRVVLKRVSGTKVTHCGFVINVGSRQDGMHPGIAHCLEHMVFKGTKLRNNIDILNHLESVGGELNAFTTKEMTAIYAGIQTKYSKTAIDLLCDVTFNSTIPEIELRKEKKVIIEEIKMYLDTPDENIYDDFIERMFKEHSLGHNILGSISTVKKVKSKDIVEFINQYYSLDNVVFSAVGNFRTAAILSDLETAFQSIKVKKLSKKTPKEYFLYKPFEKTIKTEFNQAYMMIGAPAMSETGEGRWPFLLFNNLLGGPGLNSKLNLSIREKYGLAYHVESGYQAFKDLGLFHCYVGCEKKSWQQCKEIIEKEIDIFSKNKMSTAELNAAKKQFIGQLIMSDDNRSGVMLHIGKGALRQGRALSLKEIIHKIEKIKATDILNVVNQYCIDQKMSHLIYA